MPADSNGRKDGERLSAGDFVRRIREKREAEQGFDYRRASLAIHGTICARCGREFSGKDLPLLTVHHKDGNHHNNPRDGSNWENLCVYCHEDEHSRELLAGQIGGDEDAASADPVREEKGDGMVSLADKLKAALNKGK